MSIPATTVDTSRPHPCLKCSYELGGSRLDSKCPECGKPVIESLPPEEVPVAASDEKIERSHPCPCYKCSYDLRGLAMNGKCPECGTPVADSLRGVLLHFADKAYIEQLRSGVSLVLNAILCMVILMIAGFAVTFAMGSGAIPSVGGITLIMNFASFALAIMSCVGYYKFTAPDPGFSGTDHPDTSRKVIRVVVGIQIAIAAVQFVMGLLPTATPNTTNPFEGTAGLVLIVSAVMGLASMIAFVVQFIAVMNYLNWLAKRVPDANIERRSRTYRWLLPVIYIVGLVIAIGPLIALVMYWNLLDRFRKHLRSILTTGVPAVLKGTHIG